MKHSSSAPRGHTNGIFGQDKLNFEIISRNFPLYIGLRFLLQTSHHVSANRMQVLLRTHQLLSY